MIQTPIHYSAPLGPMVRGLTIGAYAVLLLVGAGSAALWLLPMPASLAGWIGVPTVVVIALASLGFRIRGYSLFQDRLVVRQGYGRREVALDSVTRVEPAPGLIEGSVRVFGCGGLWAFSGHFEHPQAGRLQAYVSDLRKSVVLLTQGGGFVISPDDPQKFLNDFDQVHPMTS